MEQKNYWKGLEELHEDPGFLKERDKEFAEELPVEEIFNSSVVNKPANRRDFLKMLGFSVSAATLAASCRIPVKKAIPYVIKPEEIIPGVANYYASTFYDGNDYCPVLVKTRDGRPIKIEPLTSKHISADSPNRYLFGGTSARAQASVLSLYDNSRPQQPSITGKKATWEIADTEIRNRLIEAKTKGGSMVILTPTLLSPSTKQLIADFIMAYPAAKHVVYDPISYSGIAIANERNFGKHVVPGYHFENAGVIVSINADFLGTWISPVEYTRQYVQNRKVSATQTKMSRHYHIESRLSLTGSNADKRAVIKPSEEATAVVALYNKIAGLTGAAALTGAQLTGKAEKVIAQAAEDLVANKGKGLVVAGSNDPNVQVVVNAINNMLGSYGTTISLGRNSNTHQSSNKDMQLLMDDMNKGAINTLIVYGANPAYDHADAKGFSEAIKKVETTISLNDRSDETSALCRYHCPDHHYLESWNDASPKAGLFTMCQPVIWPLFQTRQAQDSLLRWMGNTDDYYTYIKNYWVKNVYPSQSTYSDSQSFWDMCVKEGAFEMAVAEVSSSNASIDAAAAANASMAAAGAAKGLELTLYEKVAMGNGRYANVPWLQEMPDPISKVVWDNYLCVSPKFAKENGLVMDVVAHTTDMVTVTAGKVSIDVPVYVQPGQGDTSVALALGYGRNKSGKAGDGVGQNAYPFVTTAGESTTYHISGVTITKLSKKYEIAMTQTHFSFEGRDAIQETSLKEYQKHPEEGIAEKEALNHMWSQTLYPEQKFPGAKWGMAIDLNSCIGCGACTVACQAENNVPVVGKTEVMRVHEMSWIRIDRYYSFQSEHGTIDKEKEYDNIEDYQDIQVVFQPMLCQHCDNAPCENVCPVNATNHSSEGLNQMAYNRCIGTRYCANNCPYKVRRFNWLDYTTADVFPWNEPWKVPTLGIKDTGMTDAMTRMVLNPDVTVRARGVMEKCSFCVQRIQEGKLHAKTEGRPLVEGDVKSACQTACPADAISFGNLNDETSKVRKDHEDGRAYYTLAELNTRPAIAYMKKVRNTDERVPGDNKPKKAAVHH
jgi:MoCo/4Fe-4S cofactor protein with predicted Tat translocation signal